MFVRNAAGGYRGTNQVAWGWFLLLFQHPHSDIPRAQLRACIRYVHLSQCGHFMMGSARVGPHTIVVSGPYGSDGLPCTTPPDLWERLHPVPDDLQDAYWSGGGHNSAGSEAPKLRAWANDHFSVLHMAGSAAYLRWKESQTNGKTPLPRNAKGHWQRRR